LYPTLYTISSLFVHCPYCFAFFFTDTPTTEIYTLSLHDALPIWRFTPSPLGKSSLSVKGWPGLNISYTQAVRSEPAKSLSEGKGLSCCGTSIFEESLAAEVEKLK